MEGIITRGTTLGGRHVNEGERVELDEDSYQKLFLTGDIRPTPENEVVVEPELQEPPPTPPAKAKKKSAPKAKKSNPRKKK